MNQRGFTLIEVMVVVAIVAVLSAIAAGYQNYIRKAALIDVLRTVTAFKTSVELCSFDNPSFAGCNSGSGTIPADTPGRYIKSVKAENGVVTVQGNSSLAALTVSTTPVRNPLNGITVWTTDCNSEEDALKKICLDVIK
ncbi:prepilin peptidase-dependent pilin [Morganella morganii]|uniref:Tfp pilus assembly protein, major pilin PilA n=1 Tax=Morganella morganii subsp. morganii KT TaxID=1124991 RepID=J7SJL3_MORMO|nr:MULTISPECIES: prepilin peptidase-dependent pilin [Morganella]AGG32086.1 Tfp pilus assembly protein, major pilin PilA [Morganella morganii subsp. morganii KT]AMG70734.1 prepilin peptidase-dependent pilin [Morganella morganii]AZP24889.1 prepilin peptidase-dependent pilin [Morganella morganii]EJK8624469.1 prepilin peptidase-dependent pilin [Morganella morganii]EKU4287505.1 prepilin peptidase-dependent pilin [Morganella morganii]